MKKGLKEFKELLIKNRGMQGKFLALMAMSYKDLKQAQELAKAGGMETPVIDEIIEFKERFLIVKGE